MFFIAGRCGARNLWPENSLLGFRNLRGLGAWVPSAYWLAQPVRPITTDRPDLEVSIRRQRIPAPAPL
jgi:hypothetical protein